MQWSYAMRLLPKCNATQDQTAIAREVYHDMLLPASASVCAPSTGPIAIYWDACICHAIKLIC